MRTLSCVRVSCKKYTAAQHRQRLPKTMKNKPKPSSRRRLRQFTLYGRSTTPPPTITAAHQEKLIWTDISYVWHQPCVEIRRSAGCFGRK